MFNPGKIVRAIKVITDIGGDGRVYIHAIPGTYGVVIAVVQDGEYREDEDAASTGWPTVAWFGADGRGVCDVDPEALSLIPADEICQVVS